MKILVIEDELIIRETLKSFLSKFGKVETLNTGLVALNHINNYLKNQDPYNLILLDIMLPDISGIDILHEIRGLETKNSLNDISRSKIIMISALCNGETIKETYNEECDAYIIKPVTEQKLIPILDMMEII